MVQFVEARCPTPFPFAGMIWIADSCGFATHLARRKDHSGQPLRLADQKRKRPWSISPPSSFEEAIAGRFGPLSRLSCCSSPTRSGKGRSRSLNGRAAKNDRKRVNLRIVRGTKRAVANKRWPPRQRDRLGGHRMVRANQTPTYQAILAGRNMLKTPSVAVQYRKLGIFTRYRSDLQRVCKDERPDRRGLQAQSGLGSRGRNPFSSARFPAGNSRTQWETGPVVVILAREPMHGFAEDDAHACRKAQKR